MLCPLPHTANFSLFIVDAVYLTPSCFIPFLNPAILIYVPTTKSFHMSSYFLLLLLCFVCIEIFCSIYDWKFMFSHWNLNIFLFFYRTLPGMTCYQGSKLDCLPRASHCHVSNIDYYAFLLPVLVFTFLIQYCIKKCLIWFYVVVVQLLSHIWLFVTPWTIAH